MHSVILCRFDDDCPLFDLIKSVPHIVFEVDNIDEAIREHDFEIISEPGIPSEGVRTAMIRHNGAPVELIEFTKTGLFYSNYFVRPTTPIQDI